MGPARILLIDGAAVAASLAAPDVVWVEAADAAAAWQAAQSESFDGVLIDGARPGAAELVAKLASADGGLQAVIALSDDPETTAALLRAGALDAIPRNEAGDLARALRYAKARRAIVADAQAAREDAHAQRLAFDRLNRQTMLILSVIAHDLRSPFQVLLGMSEILLRDVGDATATARRAGVLHEAAVQAHGLLESLFAWASLHMDARAEKAVVAVETLFADCVRALQEQAEAKGVRLESEASDLRVLAQADAAAAILRNLVANALKFTDSGGRVTLSAARRDGAVALAVSDTGIGIAEAQIAQLFTLENRYTSAGTDGERGAGLGLLLCRHLTDWIGGALEVESAVGAGTTFTVLLGEAGRA